MTSEPALISAAKTGNIAAVRQLLSASPGSVTGTFDEDGRCALCWAAEEGHLEVLEVLVAAGASLNNHDGVRKEIMPWILGAAHTAGSPSEKPLMLWAERVDASPVRNLTDRTPLHLALEVGKPALVGPLLAAGADANARTNWTPAPLHTALQSLSMGSCRPDQRPDAVTDELWCVEALLAAGCDVSIPVYESEDGLTTPLQAAAVGSSAASVEILFAAGASPRGALHSAAIGRGNVSEMRTLLELGCAPDATDEAGRTALDLCFNTPRRGYGAWWEKTAALLAFGAKPPEPPQGAGPDPRLLAHLSRAVVVAAERAEALDPRGAAAAECKRELLRIARGEGAEARPGAMLLTSLARGGVLRRWSPGIERGPVFRAFREEEEAERERETARRGRRALILPPLVPRATAEAIEAARARFPPALRLAAAAEVCAEEAADAEAESARRSIALLESLPRPIGGGEAYAEGAPARPRLLLCAAACGVARWVRAASAHEAARQLRRTSADALADAHAEAVRRLAELEAGVKAAAAAAGAASQELWAAGQ